MPNPLRVLGALLDRPRPAPERANETVQGLTVTDWARMFRPGENVVIGGMPHTAWQVFGGPAGSFEGNSIVFALESKRILVFSEARLQWQQLRGGRPGDLFGTPDLQVLETPWPGATTRDLLAIAELDVATSGNSYWVRDPVQPQYLLRLEPAAMKVITEAVIDPMSGQRVGERLLGYAHVNDRERDRVTIYAPDEVAHYKPYPSTQFVGRSWLSACLPDIDADQMLTSHKVNTLRQGANLGYVVSLDASLTPDEFGDFVRMFREFHDGPENSGKTVFLGGGADVKTVGQTWEALNVKAVQGAGETRLAAAAGVHPVVVGLSEGLAGSALNAGNYSSAKRSFVDTTMRPLWGAFAGAIQALIGAPTGARLWYDDRDIPFLREDVKDQAEIHGRDAQTIRTLIDAGYQPDAVVDAVVSGQFNRLIGQHSGLYSVQLQKPGEQASAQPPTVEAP